jgi:carbonic anhydrase/acetyltransferase-like protein (isoleucine patch superfamily)
MNDFTPTPGGILIPFRGKRPRVAPDAFIAPTAVLIGDVEVGPQSGIWFGCVLRADTNTIRIGARSNIQDGTIIHVNPPAEHATIIGDDVTVGTCA